MSTAARRIACLPQAGLQVEERPRAPLKTLFKATLKATLKATTRSNGNGHARTNGNGHAGSNGNGRGNIAANGHSNGHGNGDVNGMGAANGANGNGASHHPARPRVIVAAENRLSREALSRMLTKTGDVEVLTSEAADLFAKPLQNGAQSNLQSDADRQCSEPETRILAGILECGDPAPLL